MLMNLVPEIREHILTYCSISDLKNLACTNSWFNEELKKPLYHTVGIQQNVFQKKGFLNKLRLNKKVKKEVENLRGTRVVYLDFHDVSQHSIEVISTLNNLIELNLCGNENEYVDDSKIATLCNGLKGLKKLDAGSYEITDGVISHIVNLVTLEELCLRSSGKITDVGYSQICTLTKLKKLSISGLSCITNEGMSDIAKLVALEELCFECGHITDAALLSITSNLKRIDLRGCYRITDMGLSYIANFVTLEELSLRSCNGIMDTGLSYTGTLTQLKKLDLHGCYRITDMGMSYIAKLVTLEDLCLRDCEKITNAGRSYIVNLTKLKRLDVSGCYGVPEFPPRKLPRPVWMTYDIL